MKKLLKFFAVPAILACGLLVGCNNGDMDLDLNVTVSTQAPSLDDPKNLGYGVLLTWNYTQDGNMFRVTRQKKGGSPVTLAEFTEGNNFYFDAAGLNNVLEADVEYTYRVYSLGAKSNGRGGTVANYNNGYVVRESYAEKRITLKAEDIKAQNEPLPKIDAEKVNYSFKNGVLKIAFSGDFDRLVGKKFEVTDKATDKKMNVSDDDDDGIWTASMNNDDVEEISVAIVNIDENDYYADSEAVTIPSIKNIKDADVVTISTFSATLRDGKVVLLWTTSGKEDVAAADFAIQRKIDAAGEKYETLKITPTSGTKYDGTTYWTASDESIEVGKSYTYKVITDYDSETSSSVNTKAFIWLYSPSYDVNTNTVTLKWNASTDISEFTIYRADEKITYYYYNDKYIIDDVNDDLLKPIKIEIEKLYEIIDGKNNPANVFTAKDATVEKNKDYTYVITPKLDGVTSTYSVDNVSTGQSASGSVSLAAAVYDKDGSSKYSSTIEEPTDYVVLSFNGDVNATYKGYWATVNNKGEESARKEFDFTKDSDGHYQKKFKTSDIASLSKPVDFKDVVFYVQQLVGDKMVKEVNEKVQIDESLTSYTVLDSIWANQEDPAKREITVRAYGQNFDKNIKVTYFKDDGDITPATLTWEFDEENDIYTAKFTVSENGSYTVCANVPMDNMYDYNKNASFVTKTDTVRVN